MHLSIVLATYNRPERLDATLTQLAARLAEELPKGQGEIIVVANPSPADNRRVVAGHAFARLIELERDAGACAKARGLREARGEISLCVDDDSYPWPGSLTRLLAHFRAKPRLGAAGFEVHLPDGGRECSALPHVFVGAGVGLRTRAVRAVGGLDASFYMQAEEYDLSFRLLQAGWQVDTFADLHVDHLKDPAARSPARRTYFDTRNNLRLAARYLPEPYRAVYSADWRQRYRWLAENQGHTAAYRRGVWAARLRSGVERIRHHRQRLSAENLEQLFAWARIEEHFAELTRRGVRRVVFADLGKNVYAFHRAAARCGVRVLAVGDDQFGAPHIAGRRRQYRGTPVLPLAAALAQPAQALVVSNTAYVHAASRAVELARRTGLPVETWFRGPSSGVRGSLTGRMAGNNLLGSAARMAELADAPG